jgi:putative DNA primase/helicase
MTRDYIREITGMSPMEDRTKPEAKPEAVTVTEDSAALEFAARYRDELRFDHDVGKWFRWNGKVWEREHTKLAFEWSRQLARELAGTVAKSKQLSRTTFAAGVERFAQADRALAVTIGIWDGDPWLLNTQSGTVDLRSGVRWPHKRDNHLTKIAGVAPGGAAPTWLAFLDRVTDGNQELIDYLQRMAGYCLTGSTKEHALFFLYGTGANGKSTFLNAITGALGDYHRPAPIETFTASNGDRHPTDLAGLRGARLVTAIETEEGRRWAESRIKTLTGGDKISARFMRQDFFDYTPQFKLLIAGNHKPGLRSVDEAIRRRFNLVPFTVTIPPKERDKELGEKLQNELPGILAWMIAGCMAWQKCGLAPPKVVTDATAAYLEAEDALVAWLEECCEHTETFTTSTCLFRSWSDWAGANGEHVGSLKRFVAALEARGFTPGRRTYGRGFENIKLKPTLVS